MPRRICVVVTARPSYARVKSVLTAIRNRRALELHVVVAASALLDRYGSAVRTIEQDGFPIAARLYTVLEGDAPALMAKTTGLGLIEMATTLERLRPDVVVTIADRYETLATATTAAYMNIPLAHLLGGEMTGSIDDKVRHAVTQLADLHFVATQQAAWRVMSMGHPPDRVFVTGCPSVDIAAEVLADPALRFDPIDKYGGVGPRLDLSSGYLLVLQQPVTTEFEAARHQIVETLHAIRAVNLPTLWFWPNVDAGADGAADGIRTFREQEKPANVHFFKNMAPPDFLRVLYNCRCLVGNSSVGLREAAFLAVPTVNIGSRQTGRERARNVLDAPHDRRAIADAVAAQLRRGRVAPDPLYGDGSAGERIADILERTRLPLGQTPAAPARGQPTPRIQEHEAALSGIG
ncbi:MAG: UDP-N-acetylglucosamine 2-epimerase [Phycisphaerae bacterium]